MADKNSSSALHQTINGPQLHSIAETMRVLGIGRTSVYALIASGKLRVLKLGRRTLIPASAIADLIAELEREAA